MNERATFRRDLYGGAADYYDKFRLGYPEAMLADLASRVGLDGSGDLLDVACGTGQVAFALARHIAYIVGIDQEPGMVNFAAAKAAAMGLRNSEWHVARAEEFVADGFRLVTIGNAFHRLDRPAVAERARHWLRPGGFLALLWTPVLTGSSQWQLTLDGCVSPPPFSVVSTVNLTVLATQNAQVGEFNGRCGRSRRRGSRPRACRRR